MSTELLQLSTGREDIGPFIHADHWQGHTLGQGEIDNTRAAFQLTPTAREFAAATITRYLQDRRGRMAHQTYSVGGTFRPEEWDDGTIVAYRHEMLASLTLGRSIDVSDIEAAPICTEIPNGKHFESQWLTARVRERPEKISYRSTPVWGVVARPGGTPAVVSVFPHDIQGQPPDATATAANGEHEGPVVVGEVNHWEIFGLETLSRVNRLEVCTYGAYLPR